MKIYTTEQLAAMSDVERKALFTNMATEYAQEHGCRWSEAMLEVKRKYVEARVAFGAPMPA